VRKNKTAIPQVMAEKRTVVGIERSALVGKLRSVTVDYFGDKLNVTYKPSEMSPAKEAELARLRKEAEEAEEGDDAARGAEQLASRLAEVMVSWDVVEDGEPLPPTKTTLMEFPNALLVHISSAIGDDMRPNPKTGRR
jgi:hypothetical protein